MTNHQYVKQLPVKELAKLLVYEDEYYVYVCPDGAECYTDSDAIKHTVNWLNSEISELNYEFESREVNDRYEEMYKAVLKDFESYMGDEGQERCAYCAHDDECEPGEMLCSYKGDSAFEWRGMLKKLRANADDEQRSGSAHREKLHLHR